MKLPDQKGMFMSSLEPIISGTRLTTKRWPDNMVQDLYLLIVYINFANNENGY